MSRNSLGGFQKTSANLVPEFNYDIQDTSDVQAWAGLNADITPTVIPYSQFQAETGYGGKHPLANLGQTNVLKLVIDTTNTALMQIATDIAFASAADMSRGTVGSFIYMSEADHTSLTNAGGNFLKYWVEDGSISHYTQFIAPVININTADSWTLLGGLFDDANYSNLITGTPDSSAIDKLRFTIDTDGGSGTLYVTSFFYGGYRRPTIMFEQDDLGDDVATYVTDSETYGLTAAFNAIESNTGGLPTADADLKNYLDNGHVVYGHGADGMRALGDTDGKAQLENELSFWRAFYPSVLTDTTLMHHALPLGENTKSIREYMRTLGYKTIRRTGTSAYNCLISQQEYGDTEYLHFPSMDVGSSADSIIGQAHLKACIKHGIDACFVVHRYDSIEANRSGVQALMADIQRYRNLGLIETMPRHEWYERSIKEAGQRNFV